MAVAIIACPSCKTLLLSDTAQCPSCSAVLDQSRIDALAEPAVKAALSLVEEEPEDECTGCGEMVRRGLVRCWNCSSFMRKDIARTYEDMRTNAEPIIYQPLPEFDGTMEDFGDDAIPMSNYDETDGGDDFELDESEAEKAQSAAMAEASAGTEESYSVEGASDTEAADKPAAATPSETSEESSTEKRATEPEEGAEDHSVATGGDVLLQVAMEQEAEREKRLKELGLSNKGPQLRPGNFLAFCPNGHRIEVGEKHRGKTGRCPRCQQPFVVPEKTWVEPKPEKPTAAEGVAGKEGDKAQSKCRGWLNDVHLHTVHPEKLKLKEGSLAATFEKRDVVFTEEGLVLITFGSKKGGLFGGGAKSDPEEQRQAVREHLEEGNPLDKLPEGITARLIENAKAKSIHVVQPSAEGEVSMFHGVDVFGKGRMAAKVPREEKGPESDFLSFTLTEYREFVKQVQSLYELPEFGSDRDVPLEEEYSTAKCHYTDDKVKFIEHVEFYQADPAFEPELVGRKCQECGIVVGEETRKKEKLGGANGKAIAKAKCPKCEKKFGNISLYNIPAPVNTESEAAEEPGFPEMLKKPVEPAKGSAPKDKADKEQKAKADK